jgi:hypothetical protein
MHVEAKTSRLKWLGAMNMEQWARRVRPVKLNVGEKWESAFSYDAPVMVHEEEEPFFLFMELLDTSFLLLIKFIPIVEGGG